MAEHVLAANLLLRYDTFSNWNGSSTILKEGEAAVAVFPSDDISKVKVGIKIGNGRNYFRELPWIQAIAADVYDWAKNSNRPDYYAEDILGLSEYIQQYITEVNPNPGSSSSSYRIIYNSLTKKYILQQYDEETSSWKNTTSVIDFSDILSRLNSIENWANGGGYDLGNINEPLDGILHDYMLIELNTLNYTDSEQEHQFVTGVNETKGKISVNRSPIYTSDINGTFPVSQGGTGATSFTENSLLVGNGQDAITTKPYVTRIESDSTNSIPTVGAVVNYITAATAGITGAMHFIGEATVTITDGSSRNPEISGYNFSNAIAGDVILYNNAEFVWTGNNWRSLGDEGSYAVKGSIMNEDISDEAEISINKIADLTDILNSKVDKEDRKTLYPIEDKEKLATIESNAQVNVIEHIKLNNNELPIDNTKTVNIDITEYTNKLETIEEGAQVNRINAITLDGTPQTPDISGTVALISNPHEEHVNKIEHIFINGTEKQPETINGKLKSIDISIDESALTFQILKGARYPNGNTYTDIDIDQTTKKLELSQIAATGNISNLLQTQNTYIILDCGTSNSDIHRVIS